MYFDEGMGCGVGGVVGTEGEGGYYFSSFAVTKDPISLKAKVPTLSSNVASHLFL